MRLSLGGSARLDDGRGRAPATFGKARDRVISRPPHLAAYEFAVVAALRAQQLLAGCTPRLCGEHSAATMAQMEVAEGCVARSGADEVVEPPQCGSKR
jgi:DNA-directed RNA polymerase subunit K/omega